MEEPLEGIAAADARLGRAFPLPAAPLPLARWVDVRAAGDGTEVVWALDDSRTGTPGRLALYAGPAPPPEHDVAWDGPPAPLRLASGVPAEERTAALGHAQASLRPVRELRWRADGLYLRLTGQGPWAPGELAAIAGSVTADR